MTRLRRLAMVALLLALLQLVLLAAGQARAATEVTVTLRYSVQGGGTGGGAPSITFVSNGTSVTQALTVAQSAYIMDSGSRWNVSAVLPASNSSERWATPVNSGVASSSMQSSFVYYHQAYVSAGYSDIGGTGPAPTVNFTQFGVRQSTPAGPKLWLDVGTVYTYKQTVLASNPSERWQSLGPVSGVVTSSAKLSIPYYHQYLTYFSFTAVGGSPATIPSVDATSLGTATSITLASNLTSIWLDAGSLYVAATLTPPTGAGERWLPTPQEGAATGVGSLTFRYYHQYTVRTEFSVIGGPVPGQPGMNYTSTGASRFITVSPMGTSVWADFGTACSVSGLLPGGSADERWAASGITTVIVDSPGSLSLSYFHQYSLDIGLDLVGGGAAFSPALNYTSMGSRQSVGLGHQEVLWADNGTALTMTNSTTAAGGTTRWMEGTKFPQTVNGPITGAATYYYQVQALVSYQIEGGGNPSPPAITFGYLGVETRVPLMSSSSPIWIDQGAGWSAQLVIQSSPGERWAEQGPAAAGSAQAPFAALFTYAHQYRIATRVGSYGGGQIRNVTGWYAPGDSVQLQATASSGWEFGMWAGSRNITANPVVMPVSGPLTEFAVFNPSLTVTAGADGAVSILAGDITGTATPSHGVVVFVPPGSTVLAQASTSSFTRQFSSWSGIPQTTMNPVQFTVNAPMVVSASFVDSSQNSAAILVSAVFVVAGAAIAFDQLRHNGLRTIRSALRRVRFGKR